MRLKIKVIPNACKDEISGWQGEWLKVRVQAPPNDGKANEAVRSLLADAFHVPKQSIRIQSGNKSRLKIIEAVGLDAQHPLLLKQASLNL